MADTSTTRFVGEWEIMTRIGSGSFSTVWKAQNRRTEQCAAIKEITTAKLSADYSKCLDAELAAMRGMHHPNIVAFYELIKERDRMFIVMEYCRDGELQTVISNKRCDERFVQRCMAQLAAGLKALHSAKIVHRDLKPANLLLSDGVLKIADFGFARNLPSHNLADTLCGSPLYMAPEVLQRKRYDARADLWSVGVILYEMLVGKPPFEGQNYIHLLTNIETKPLKIPKSVAKVASKTCLDLLVRLLQRDAHKRMDFEAFFQHPFIREAPAARTGPSGPCSSAPAMAPIPLMAGGHDSEDIAIGEDEEFCYSIEDDFVVVNRIGSDSSTQSVKEINIHELKLLRIADWVMEAADMTPSRPQAFFRALISVQIIQHVVQNASSASPELSEKLKMALLKSQSISDHLTKSEATATCRASQIYAVFKEGALICAQKAAADELCGQYFDSCENYTTSVELLTFLLEEGSGVKLDPPLKLKSGEKEKLSELINAITARKEKCTPAAST